MKSHRLLAPLALLAASAACHQQHVGRIAAPASFSMRVERTDKGIAAQCATGCYWTAVTASCAGCVHRIDASGIGAASDIDDPEVAFAFNLQELEGKFVATAIKGTAWTRLSWACGNTSCSARLDESGVSPGT